MQILYDSNTQWYRTYISIENEVISEQWGNTKQNKSRTPKEEHNPVEPCLLTKDLTQLCLSNVASCNIHLCLPNPPLSQPGGWRDLPEGLHMDCKRTDLKEQTEHLVIHSYGSREEIRSMLEWGICIYPHLHYTLQQALSEAQDNSLPLEICRQNRGNFSNDIETLKEE